MNYHKIIFVEENDTCRSPMAAALLRACRLDRPVEQLDQARREAPQTAFQLLPYRAVGIDHGLLLALRLDQAVLGGERVSGCLAALSPTPVSDGGGYQALVSG